MGNRVATSRNPSFFGVKLLSSSEESFEEVNLMVEEIVKYPVCGSQRNYKVGMRLEVVILQNQQTTTDRTVEAQKNTHERRS